MTGYQQNHRVRQWAVERHGAANILTTLLKYSDAPPDAEWHSFTEVEIDFGGDIGLEPGYTVRALWER